MDVSQSKRGMVVFPIEMKTTVDSWEWAGGAVWVHPLADGVRGVCDVNILGVDPDGLDNPYSTPLLMGTLPEGFASGLDYFVSLPVAVINPVDWPDPV